METEVYTVADALSNRIMFKGTAEEVVDFTPMGLYFNRNEDGIKLSNKEILQTIKDSNETITLSSTIGQIRIEKSLTLEQARESFNEGQPIWIELDELTHDQEIDIDVQYRTTIDEAQGDVVSQLNYYNNFWSE